MVATPQGLKFHILVKLKTNNKVSKVLFWLLILFVRFLKMHNILLNSYHLVASIPSFSCAKASHSGTLSILTTREAHLLIDTT